MLGLGVLAPQGLAAGEGDQAAFVQKSREMVQAFAKDLKAELQAAIAEGGPVHAISVCNIQAPKIAEKVSQPPQWHIGRTSLKLRNPDNAPDEWETAVLKAFQQRAAAGESLASMETVERVESDGGPRYRYMKAIPLGDVCLTCHGADVAPDLKAEIDSIYPDDQATGFAAGELRGAFTVTETLTD
jgi:hypothetical protein